MLAAGRGQEEGSSKAEDECWDGLWWVEESMRAR